MFASTVLSNTTEQIGNLKKGIDRSLVRNKLQQRIDALIEKLDKSSTEYETKAEYFGSLVNCPSSSEAVTQIRCERFAFELKLLRDQLVFDCQFVKGKQSSPYSGDAVHCTRSLMLYRLNTYTTHFDDVQPLIEEINEVSLKLKLFLENYCDA